MKSVKKRENGEIFGDHREITVKTAKVSNFRCQNVKILEKIARCARHGKTSDRKNQEFATDSEKVKTLPK